MGDRDGGNCYPSLYHSFSAITKAIVIVQPLSHQGYNIVLLMQYILLFLIPARRTRLWQAGRFKLDIPSLCLRVLVAELLQAIYKRNINS